MTCDEVRRLIAALPASEWPSGTEAFARQHAERCAGCRSALAVEEAMAESLRSLPGPRPPSGLTQAVLARIEGVHLQPEVPAIEARGHTARAHSSRLGRAALICGAALGAGAQSYRILSGEAGIELAPAWPGGGFSGLPELPSPTPALLLVAAGVLLLVWGLAVAPDS